MIKIAQYEEAEDLHKIWLTQTTYERQKADMYYQLGCIKFYQGKYANALTFFENSLTIQTKTLLPNDPGLATVYNTSASVYTNLGDYSEALSSYEHASSIWEHSLPPNHPDLQNVRKHIDIMKERV